MTRRERGTSSIEALLAVTVFGIVALAAAGLATLSLRTAAAAARASRAARLATGIADSLGGDSGPDRACDRFFAGQSVEPGVTAQWSFHPVAHGFDVLIETSYRTITGTHSDSSWSFVRCR